MKPKGQTWWCASVIPATLEVEIGRIEVKGQPKKTLRSLLNK
jgi:hypothetical protein